MARNSELLKIKTVRTRYSLYRFPFVVVEYSTNNIVAFVLYCIVVVLLWT